MATYLIPATDGTESKVSRIPRAGVYRLTGAAVPANGKDYVCTGRMADGTVTHREPSKPEYAGGIADHHGAWCNAAREHFGAALVERASSRTAVDPVAARAERWARIAGDVTEA